MIDRTLFDLLPPLRRARGDRLYGPHQRHWVDLWKQDGVWLLGHRPEGVAKEWKNQIDKGLGTWAPSLWPRRLEVFGARLFSEPVSLRLFRNADRCPVPHVWRPWDDSTLAPRDWPLGAARLVLPTGPGQAVAAAFTAAWAGALPDHDVASPAEAAALVQAVVQVLRFQGDEQAVLLRRQAMEKFDRYLGPSAVFRRRGLWFEAVDSVAYDALFRAHWDAGFLLNPDPAAPGIIPTTLSDGEWAQWKAVVETWSRGRL